MVAWLILAGSDICADEQFVPGIPHTAGGDQRPATKSSSRFPVPDDRRDILANPLRVPPHGLRIDIQFGSVNSISHSWQCGFSRGLLHVSYPVSYSYSIR